MFFYFNFKDKLFKQMKKLLIIFLILPYSVLLSQNGKDLMTKNSYADLESQIIKYYGENNQLKLKETSLHYIYKAKKEANNEQLAEGYIFLHFSEKLPIALKYLDSLAVVSKKLPKNNLYPARVYLLKGNLYFKNDYQKEALSNYLKGLQFAKESQNERQIAFGEIQIAYLNNYVGKSAEAVKVLNKYLYHSDILKAPEKQELKLNLADIYMDVDKIDSAKTLIDSGMETIPNDRNSRMFNSYLSLLARYQIKTKNYKKAIENLNESKKFFNDEKNQREINYTLLYLGEAYSGLNDKKKAVEIYSKIDSLVEKTNYTFPELREVYPFIIDYYKQNNNKEKQLYYIERFLKVDKMLDSDFRYISREIPRLYDRPKLLEEKEILQNEMERKKIIFYLAVFFLSFIILALIYYYDKMKKQKNIHQEKAKELVQSLERINAEKKYINTFVEIKEAKENSKKDGQTVPDETKNMIIKGLERFADEKQFLKKKQTLQSVAKNLDTNSAYLSEVINTYKNKNFSTYLNDLRIEFAIQKLAEDKKLRSYTIAAIAEELGYNNEQAFSLAFKKTTGTTVSTYIKEINKNKNLKL